jgi:hypothetical protein
VNRTEAPVSSKYELGNWTKFSRAAYLHFTGKPIDNLGNEAEAHQAQRADAACARRTTPFSNDPFCLADCGKESKQQEARAERLTTLSGPLSRGQSLCGHRLVTSRRSEAQCEGQRDQGDLTIVSN